MKYQYSTINSFYYQWILDFSHIFAAPYVVAMNIFCICLLMHIFKGFFWILSKNEIDGSYYIYICLFSRSGWIIFWSCCTNFHSIFYMIIVCVSSSGKMPVPIFLIFLICKSPFFIIPFAWIKKMYLDINPLSIVCLSFGFWLDKKFLFQVPLPSCFFSPG